MTPFWFYKISDDHGVDAGDDYDVVDLLLNADDAVGVVVVIAAA